MNARQASRFSWFILLLAGLAAGIGASRPVAADPDSVAANAGWEEVGAGSASGGGISNNNGYSSYPSLAVGPDGAPIVAWLDDDSSGGASEIYVRRWNGSAWVEMGSGSASGGGISKNNGGSVFPSLAIDADGAPVVAWHDNSGGDVEIYVRRWNGSAWVEIGSESASDGGISDNSGQSSFPSLAIGLDGAPIIAWLDDSGGGSSEIYVRRWNGTAWVEMGSGSASGGGISNTSGKSEDPFLIVGPDGAPIITWADDSSSDVGDYGIYLRRWNGTAWVEMGGSASGYGISNNTSGWAGDPSLVIGPGGSPIVAWADESNGTYEIYVRRWNGLAWVEMGSGSASGGGISNTSAGSSWHPSMAAGLDGAPIVAWYDYSVDNFEIYARRWNGAAWVEMSSGSASGSGISNNSSRSVQPSLAIGANGAPIVAWYDESSTNSEIFVRRYQSTCYTLTRAHSGQGGDPTANPANSTGCGMGQYVAGQQIALTAAPVGGWRVGGWAGTDNDLSTSQSNTVTMPAADHWISVIYELDEVEVDCYFLTLSHSGQGAYPTVNPSASTDCTTFYYATGELITLTAAPAAGWHVSGWSGTDNDSSTALSNLLTMPSNHHTVSVIYAPDAPTCYTLTRTHSGQGADPAANPANSTGCDTGQYVAGQVINLTAAPAGGWRVKNWSGTANDGSAAATNSLTMPDEDHAVGVTYEPIPVVTHYLFAPAILYRPATCFPWPNEREPNDSQAQAVANGPLCNGQTYSGLPTDAYDIFYFVVNQTGDVSATLDNHAGSGVQFTLHYEAVTQNPLDQDYTPADGFHVSAANAAPGGYFVVIHTAAPDAGSTTPYTLRVTFGAR